MFGCSRCVVWISSIDFNPWIGWSSKIYGKPMEPRYSSWENPRFPVDSLQIFPFFNQSNDPMTSAAALPPCHRRSAACGPRAPSSGTANSRPAEHRPPATRCPPWCPRATREAREAREGSWVRNVDEMMKQDETSAIISFLYTRHLSWWRQSWHRTSFTYSFNCLKQVDSWWIQLNTIEYINKFTNLKNTATDKNYENYIGPIYVRIVTYYSCDFNHRLGDGLMFSSVGCRCLGHCGESTRTRRLRSSSGKPKPRHHGHRQCGCTMDVSRIE